MQEFARWRKNQLKEAAERLNFLEKFISTHYLNQPPWARTATFLILPGLFVYAVYRLVGGEYSVMGMVWEEVEKDGRKAIKQAKDYEVRIGDKLFATNSQGMYYLILHPIQYYKLLATRTITFDIQKKDESFLEMRTTKFLYVEGGLERITVSPGFAPVSSTDEPSTPDASAANPFLMAAWAAAGNDTGRLFVESITLKREAAPVQEGTLVLEMGGTTSALRYTGTGGAPVDSIPLEPGKTMFLGTEYYFATPENFALHSRRKIVLSAKKGFFSRYTESFDLFLASKLSGDEYFVVKGDQGSEMGLRIASRYDFVIWNKRDIAGLVEKIQAEAEKNGLRVTINQSPRGFEAETNAVFSGEGIPFSVVQAVLRIIRDNHIRVKAVVYPWPLRSGKPREIQIGGTDYLKEHDEIPETRMMRLLMAKTKKEFTDETAEYVSFLKEIFRYR